ncbi:T9SS type A sorting domain-containing protein [Niastella caeni]|uniref:T9SS type A sorting domain-containing protein n=1 Tax=Niastella caeni TaxID=2569763 RepID=A0A4S8I1C6_9BACT|nr:T9SS type A sorting domain-containing protein [Niastella caeni]THU41715.1 T9SS type A sorting domain-containing protein [Niastella caeni]
MKTLYTLCTLLVLSTQQTFAQTYTFNWATSFVTSWLTGVLSGNANNINSSTVNATVSISSSQGNTAFTNFGAFAAPVVSGSPFTTNLSTITSNIAIGCDFSNKSNYADIVITFNSAVKNVSFNVADIDKLAWWSSTYFDEIVVTGTNSGLAVTNPTITKLVTGSNYVTIAGNVATANTNWGEGGNSASSVADQNGTVIVNFGSTILTAITIRYRNNTASQNNPEEQSIAIGNISFERASTLPLTLTSFNGVVNNNAVQLNWTSALEENLEKYIVEKSTNATHWQTLSTVKAAVNSNSTNEYNVTDPNAAPVNYYRLKQVDVDGNYTYSQIIRIRSGTNDKTGIKLYPNPAINAATVTINSKTKLTAHIKVYNQFGTQLQHLQRQLITGSNNIPVPGIQTLPSGTYIVSVEDEAGNKIGTTSFIKQ